MKILAGLGNPGREYEGTRHNIGFELLRELAGRYDGPRPKAKFDAEIVEISIGSERLLLLAPQTYMNLSGRSVRKAVDFYQATPADVLVACDDINLPLGRIRLRASGSAGGQKGLADILRQLGTQEVPRLRMGVGSPPAGRDASGYVLGRFGKSEMPVVESMVRAAADAVEVWVREGLAAAMNRYNPAAKDSAEG